VEGAIILETWSPGPDPSIDSRTHPHGGWHQMIQVQVEWSRLSRSRLVQRR
jgi:hypothetical protein